jgi:hypothetical protein
MLLSSFGAALPLAMIFLRSFGHTQSAEATHVRC